MARRNVAPPSKFHLGTPANGFRPLSKRASRRVLADIERALNSLLREVAHG